MQSLSECDEEKENKILYITKVGTNNENDEMTTNVSELSPIIVEDMEEPLHSTDKYDVIIDAGDMINEDSIAESSAHCHV
ncbi:uncharacterized protein LOC143905590 isoform X2 [Temnothorax americanus]|uniref:uncharacterized protein LOC143905590 isoform X2 n=1 Tax=Temnothorax americanus TaxID=1964332 RepID=UPI004068CF23